MFCEWTKTNLGKIHVDKEFAKEIYRHKRQFYFQMVYIPGFRI